MKGQVSDRSLGLLDLWENFIISSSLMSGGNKLINNRKCLSKTLRI